VYKRQFVFVQTGYYPPIKAGKLKRKFKKLYERSADLGTLRKALLKAARDVPFSNKNIKVVGANCHCVVLRPNGAFEGGPKALGRSTLLEMPNFLGPGASYSDIMVDTDPGPDGPAWGHPLTRNSVRLKRTRCSNPKCKSPMLPDQERCGVCNEPR